MPKKTEVTAKGIKKPCNSFFMYRRDMKQKIEQEYKTSNSHEVSKICSALWSKEPPHVKEYYRNVSVQAHLEHKKQYPDFDWNPHKNMKFKPKKPSSMDSLKSNDSGIYVEERERKHSFCISESSYDIAGVSPDILEWTRLDSDIAVNYDYCEFTSPIASPDSVFSSLEIGFANDLTL
ncbi:hypothetical protein HDV06_003184 [Boothiomyces sp. JEL0866]|nr:hypothetical protein HDV06_003184 [Boothiomyces sp. JEL0866]